MVISLFDSANRVSITLNTPRNQLRSIDALIVHWHHATPEDIMNETPDQTDPSTATRDAIALVQAIGQSLNMATLYGMDHKVTRASLEGSYPAVALFVDIYGHLDINITDGSLLINGNPSEAPLAGTLASKFAKHDLLCFEIVKGLTLDEYLALFALLLAPPSKNGNTATSKLNEAGGFSHIQARSVEYRRIAEGDIAPTTPEPTPPPPPSPEPPDLDNILAFLKDDQSANTQRSAEDIRQLAGDAEKLAELIIRTIEVRASSSNLADGESLTDIVVGTIGKIVNELTTPASIRTEKGRKQIKRSLMILEKAVLQKLHQIAGSEASEAAEALLDEAADSLDMENMASKFLKNKKAADESEEKLRRLIAKTDNDPEQLATLHDTMINRGLSEDGWQELMISRDSRKGMGEAETASGLADVITLTMLLAKLGETIDQSREAPIAEALRTLADETDRQMKSLVDKTERKISALKQMLGQATETEAGKPDMLSRKQLLEFLAEIGQELSQPLTVVAATVDMLRAQRAGILTEAQGELLNMTFDSTARLSHLVDCLIRIAGNPKTTHPDEAIRTVLYNTSPLTP
jgi:hypothetical protein